MKILFTLCFLCLPLVFILTSCDKQIGHSYETDFNKYFEGFDGAFVLYDYNNKFYIRHNEKKCSTRYSPCSTFKIPNSLIALQLGIIKPGEDSLKWDGVQRNREVLNMDHDLKSAFKNSVVWYYQKLAEQTGESNYEKFLSEFNYGNRDISGGLTNFWLYSSLEISPDEQVYFLERLYTYNLPIDSIYIDIVKELMKDEETEFYTFNGKTGSGIKDGSPDIGWFTGTIELGTNIYIFATFIEGEDANGMKAKEISKRILNSMRLM